MKLLAICALSLLCWTGPAAAWGMEGHKIVCAIAYDELTPAALDRVATILKVSSREEFADACNWADEVRRQRPETAGWHYVNVPKGGTSVDLVRDCAGPHSCVVAQIETDAAALKQQPADPAGTLKFLIHFVGDVHQPLHVSYAEDRGGNDIKGAYFGEATNLHAVWDGGLIEHDGPPWRRQHL